MTQIRICCRRRSNSSTPKKHDMAATPPLGNKPTTHLGTPLSWWTKRRLVTAEWNQSTLLSTTRLSAVEVKWNFSYCDESQSNLLHLGGEYRNTCCASKCMYHKYTHVYHPKSWKMPAPTSGRLNYWSFSMGSEEIASWSIVKPCASYNIYFRSVCF